MFCKRCKKNLINQQLSASRCIDCLNYAKEWQKNRTKKLKLAGKCITCAKIVFSGIRCDECNYKKVKIK